MPEVPSRYLQLLTWARNVSLEEPSFFVFVVFLDTILEILNSLS